MNLHHHLTHMRGAFLLALTLSLASLAGTVSPAHAALEDRFARAVASSGLGGHSSVVVYRSSDGLIMYQHGAERAVPPASNQKLYTAAAALEALGPEHRFETSLALEGVQQGGVFTGNVYLIGGGDPTLSTRTFAIRNQAGKGANIDLLTLPLRLRGIKEVRGKLIVDESWLDSQRYVRAWPARFRFDETTALGGLTVNQSYLGRCLCGRAAHDPAVYAGQLYLQLLAARGISVKGGVEVGVTPPTAPRVGLVESPPLRDIVAFMNRRSDNFTAEVLLKNLGRIKRGTGTTRAGSLAARQALEGAGITMTPATIADGSGLAVPNRTTSRHIVDLLSLMERDPELSDEWLDSMAVAGVSGTLRHRLRAAPYRGRVRGKTGTLRAVSALSGYATRVSTGERFGFSVVTSTGGPRVSYPQAHRLQEAVAAILVR